MTSDGGFEEFYAASYRPLLRVLLPLVVDAHAAEELAQEAFLRAYRSLGTWRREAEFSTWLFAVATNITRERS